MGGVFGGGFLSGGKDAKNYSTCLTYMKSFEGKNVVMTGATGGIGSIVAKKLLKAGNFSYLFYNFYFLGARVIMFVQDPTKVDYSLKIKDPQIKSGRNYIPITLNLREPY